MIIQVTGGVSLIVKEVGVFREMFTMYCETL